MKNDLIFLEAEQQEALEKFVNSGVRNVHLVKRARVILRLNRNGKKDHLRIGRICEELELSRQALCNIRNDFLKSQSIEGFLTRKVRMTPPVPAKVTGEVEAYVIAMACSKPPEGYARWTVRLLADRIELDCIGKLSKSTVHTILKKRNISLT
jgi:hypothetical protein